MIKAVVFDFDGTIANSNDIKHRNFYRAAEHFGIPSEAVRQVLAEYEGLTRRVIFEHLISKSICIAAGAKSSVPSVDQITAFFTQICEEDIVACDGVPSALDFIYFLHSKGFLLFINSGTPEDTLRVIAEKRGLGKYFKGIFGKPASKEDNMKRASEMAGVGFDQILHIGDGEDDRIAAEVLNCQFLGLTTPPPRFTQKPKFLIDNFSSGWQTALEALYSRGGAREV